MEIQLPRNLEARQATLILDDGRRVDVSGSGHVYVSRSATQLGGEDYTRWSCPASSMWSRTATPAKTRTPTAT
jgi:hypothetical protein